MIKAPCLWQGPCGAEYPYSILKGKNQVNIKQTFLQSKVQIGMFDDAFQWAKPIYNVVDAFW